MVGWLVSSKLVRIWRVAFVAQLEVLSRNLAGGIRITSVTIAGLPAEIKPEISGMRNRLAAYPPLHSMILVSSTHCHSSG
jgi:hypothetical protein